VPCVNLAGDETWTEIQATDSGNEERILNSHDDEICNITIPGPSQIAGGPKDTRFTYGVGVLRKQGIHTRTHNHTHTHTHAHTHAHSNISVYRDRTVSADDVSDVAAQVYLY
jgi:hypothetical protein